MAAPSLAGKGDKKKYGADWPRLLSVLGDQSSRPR